jgi:hypothetical protein
MDQAMHQRMECKRVVGASGKREAEWHSS